MEKFPSTCEAFPLGLHAQNRSLIFLGPYDIAALPRFRVIAQEAKSPSKIPPQSINTSPTEDPRDRTNDW
jgi:hypothetical protein